MSQTIKTKVTQRLVVKTKADVRFPAIVSASSPLILNKNGLSYTFSLDSNYIADSVTPAVIASMSGAYQPLDATLTGLAALDATAGILAQTGADTFVKRTFDTDGTLAANSDTRVATQKAVKTYVDAHAGSSAIAAPQARATLTSGVAVTTSDVTAATSIYCTPMGGGYAPIYSGSAFVPTAITELTLALDSNSGHTGYHQSGKNFDTFVINDASTIRFGSGPTWNAGAVAGSDTARGTGAGSTELELVNGILVNKSAITIRFGSASGNTVAVAARQATFIGSFRTTADGQTEDSLAKRFVSNAYNQTIRPMRVSEATASWPYSSGTIRQANSNAANQLAFICCMSGIQVDAELQATFSNSTSTIRSVDFAISLDSTTTYTQNNSLISIGTGFNGSINRWRGFPGLGYHVLTWLEQGAGSDTQTWYGQQYSYLMGGILG